MSTIDVQDHFAQQASDYKNLMIRLIPQYQEQQRIIGDLLPEDPNRPYRVLDLGCGSGVLSEIVIQKLPQAHLIGFDITPAMLEAFEQTISRYTRNYQVIQGDYKRDPIGDRYDLIVTGLTLHHLRWDERKEFYKILFKSMNSGSRLISSDIILDEDEAVQAHQYTLWKQHMSSQGEDPEFWYQKHLQKDFPIDLSTHLNGLREAGFIEAACYWRLYNFAITSARKS